MTRFIRARALCSLIAAANLITSLGSDRDSHGGWRGLPLDGTGYFTARQAGERWWLVTPEGNAFISKGVNHISYTADTAPKLGYAPYGRVTAAKYGSAEKWAEATVSRWKSWGYNTVGAWSSPALFTQKIPYTLLVGAAEAGGANWQRGEVADVFAPRFAEAVRERAKRVCSPRVNDPQLLGYFTDNELRWGADWRSKKSLFESFLQKQGDSPGKTKALELVRAAFPEVAQMNTELKVKVESIEALAALPELPDSESLKELRARFLREYAAAYFKTCREAIKAADPNHLILGCRFAGYAPVEVMEAMAPFVDVVSFNNYGEVPPKDQLARLHQITGKPIIIGEFSFKAMDSGLPNTKGAGKPVATQRDRAEGFQRYVSALMQLPFLVGYHWFEYADEPAEGRFDGENSNYGLVNIQDEPWDVLVKRMTELNERVETIHLGKKQP